MSHRDMAKLLEDRELKAMEIAELQVQKKEIEHEVLDILIDDRNHDCFSVNWNRVNTCYR